MKTQTTGRAFETAGSTEPKGEVVNFPRGVRGAKPATPEMMNDAKIHGEDSPEWQSLLTQNFTFMEGGKGAAKKWNPITRTLAKWLDREDGAGRQRGLTVHVEDAHKDGKCFVTGASVGGERRADAMDTLDAVGLDVDNGSDIADVLYKIKEQGLAALVYSTHSHLNDTLEAKRDTVLKKLKIDGDYLTDDDLRTYYREHDNHAYTDAVLDGLTIEDPDRLTADGSRIIARTIPIQKFRVVMFFDEPVTRRMRGRTDRERKENWTAAVKELGRSFGLRIDESASDQCRLFYSPRHKPDTAPKGHPNPNFEMHLIRGRALTWAEIQPKANPFLVAGAEEKEHRQYRAPSGASLNKWAATHGRGFQPAGLLESSDYDTGQGSGAFLDIICPFGDEHSKSEGGGYVKNADEWSWQWGCQHDSCSGRDRLEYVEKALADGWFEENDIAADSFAIVLDDATLAELEGRETGGTASADTRVQDGEFEPVADWLPSSRYVVKGDAIYTKGDTPVPICAKFDVVGRSSNEDGTGEAGRILSFVNENGIRVETTIFRADIMGAGDAVMRDLAGRGLMIFGRGKAASDRVLNLLNEITPKRQIPNVATPGWVRDEHGDVRGFCLPTGKFVGREDGKPIRLLEGSRVAYPKPRGDVTKFTQAAIESFKFADSNFYWTVGLAAGFSGPLLGLLKEPGCGLVFSGHSSLGKTLAMQLGAAVWASPEDGDGVLHSAKTTPNAVEDLCVMMTHTTFMFDEIGAVQDKRNLEPMLFGMSGGVSKARKKDRNIGLAQRVKFNTFIVMSSEFGLKQEIESGGGKYRAGLVARFPDIDVSGGVKVDKASRDVLEEVQQNYGHAGPVFIQYLFDSGVCTDRAKLAREVDAIVLELSQGKAALITRAAKPFAITQRAGELAADAGLLGADVIAAKNAIRTAVRGAWDVFSLSDEAGAASSGDAMLDGIIAKMHGKWDRTIISAGSIASDGKAIGEE